MPLWLIEARRKATSKWEIVSVEFDKEMAQAIQDELEADDVDGVRAFERDDMPRERADALLARADRLSAEQMNRWQPYRDRAITRLLREGR
jgi:hypothetical protein